ncbi:MAG: hypothetical protein U5K74_02340 [Gemmatimonadaceae bacterium]|nr:hypothetical protein [Gemmatimonadaceae bacterium]
MPNGRLTALIDSTLPVSIVAAVSDTLDRISILLGVQETTPVLSFLFATQDRFAARFPIGWSDGVYSDWTLAEPGIGAAVFAAVGGTASRRTSWCMWP